MDSNLRILLVIFSVFLIIIILNSVSKNKIPIKYSLFWIVAGIIILLVGAVPNFINIFTELIGFQTTSNLVVGIMLGILLCITLLLTIIISEQNKRIKLLIQEVSMIKSETNKKVKNDRV